MIHYTDFFPDREVTIKGEKYLYFGGTSYLGLQTDPDFQDIFIKNIRKYGTNYGASRKSNIRISIFEEVENYLAKLIGSDACVTLSSGYLAGQFIAQSLHKKEYKLFYAPNTHSALYVAQISANKPKTYITFSALNIALRDHLETKKTSTPVVFLDAIDFYGANYPEFEGLQILPLSDIILIVDDSHGIGIVGKNGSGVYRKIKQLKPKELIVCCSLGKGFGVQAGAIFGTYNRISELVHTDFFGGSSPASPASLANILHAEKILAAKRILLDLNIESFIKNLDVLSNFKFMEGHPAFSFANEDLTKHLEKNKILVTSFRYPNEDSHLMSKIVISASHTKNDITKICNVINYF